MGGSSEQTQQAQATPEERELNRLALQRARASQGGLIDVQGAGLNLVNQLLTGQSLPGFLEDLPGGISEEATQRIVDRSLEDVNTNAQSLGILDSGTNAELGVRTAADIRANAEQFNIQNLIQLLTAATGGQVQVQQPIATGEIGLSQRLAGLRPVTGSGGGATASQNFFVPFLQTAGKAAAGAFF